MDTQCVGNVPAAEVGAAPELVTGLGVAAAAGTELRAGGLAAATERLADLGEASPGTQPTPVPCTLCRVLRQSPRWLQHPTDHLASPHFTGGNTEAQRGGASGQSQGCRGGAGTPVPLPDPRARAQPGASPSPEGAPLPARALNSLQRLTMAVFFLTLRVLLADSEGGSSSHDKE